MLVEIVTKLCEFFEGNDAKVMEWLLTENPNLGDVTPVEMIMVDRGEKLLNFIKVSLAMNKPPTI